MTRPTIAATFRGHFVTAKMMDTLKSLAASPRSFSSLDKGEQNRVHALCDKGLAAIAGDIAGTTSAGRRLLADKAEIHDNRDELIIEAREVLLGVIAVADRNTLEFDRARALLLKLTEATK